MSEREPIATPLYDLALTQFWKHRYPMLLWRGLVKQIEEENTVLKAQAEVYKDTILNLERACQNSTSTQTTIVTVKSKKTIMNSIQATLRKTMLTQKGTNQNDRGT